MANTNTLNARQFFTGFLTGEYTTGRGDNETNVSALDENNGFTPEMIEYAKSQLEKLDKRKENRSPSSNQKQNEEIKSAILEFMDTEKTYTAAEIAKAMALLFDIGKEINTQKITPLMKQLADSNAVTIIEGYRPILSNGKKGTKVRGYCLVID